MVDNSSAHTKLSANVTIASSRIVVVDEKNMLRLWLEEKLARHELSSDETDRMLAEQDAQGKLWVGPFRDALGSGKLVYKLAHDFGAWRGASVYFTKSSAGHDLVVFKGWPAGRKIITGTRYRVDNPKIVELQVGKPGIQAAARESARFGVYLVVGVDVAEYIMRDDVTFGHLLGSLTVDVPSVLLASAIGAAAGSFVAGTSVAGLAAIGALACGPFLVAFLVGVGAGVALYELDDHFGLTDKLGTAYDDGLHKLAEVWASLRTEADHRFEQLAQSYVVNDLRQDTTLVAERLGRFADAVRADVTHAW